MTVSIPATPDGDEVLRNAVTEQLNFQFGVTNPNQLANHMMYFLPPNVMGGAYAFVGGWLSVYDDGWYVHRIFYSF